MKNQKDKVIIQSLKINNQIYKSWSEPTVLFKDDEKIIVETTNTLVSEINKTNWVIKEKAIWFFYFDKWFNIVYFFDNKKYDFYCNIASPPTFENNIIKYVDYDLDIKVFNDKSFRIIDLKDYVANHLKNFYSKEIVQKIWDSVDELKKLILNNQPPFDKEFLKLFS